MGKRSNFKRNPRDFYPTPEAAVLPLLPHLKPETMFMEPCCGEGDLVRALRKRGHICTWASDISDLWIGQDEVADALEIEPTPIRKNIITNPPWDRKVLHPMIEHFRQIGDTWLLFDADWMHTKQSAPFMLYCEKIVSVGRVKWIPDSKMTGKDNAAWFLFTNKKTKTEFYGR